jgi:triosephosphate isomerase
METMSAKILITFQDVEAARRRGASSIPIPLGAVITPLARDVARRLAVRLEPARHDARRGAVFGNWKANGTAAEATTRARAIAAAVNNEAGKSSRDVAIFPPHPHLTLVAAAIAGSTVQLGAQDVSPFGAGATTGGVPVEMLRDLGVTYALVGHSERRHRFGETNDLVRDKLRRALTGGLRPVLCVGETLAAYDAGRTFGVLRRQLLHALDRMPPQDALRLTVAYEPVWAIGSGLMPTADEIEACLGTLRDHVARRFDDRVAERVRLLYGGSVNADNANAILRLPSCDGALVGGASLQPERFARIAMA